VSYKTPDGKRDCVRLMPKPEWEGDYRTFYFELDAECDGMWNVVVTLGERHSGTLSPSQRTRKITFFKTTVLNAGDSWRADITKL
jgi:hypothetical protein